MCVTAAHPWRMTLKHMLKISGESDSDSFRIIAVISLDRFSATPYYYM